MFARDRGQIEARFWAKVDKSGDCWLWVGAHNGNSGHGQFQFPAIARGGRLTSAHRASWYFAHGEIPQGLHVCHHCDNPPCVNPAHLFLGTAKDNMHDAIQKGRFKFPAVMVGERNNRAKLTWDIVRSIRTAAAAGDNFGVLSRRYGVARSTLQSVVVGETWKEPGMLVQPRRAYGMIVNRAQKAEMRLLYLSGIAQRVIAAQFGVSPSQTSFIVRGLA